MPKSVLALLAVAVLAAPAAAEDLPRDPNNVYGKFDNGLEYVIRHNANPPGRVQFYLHVKTGALNETDQQNGLAHFIEHMAFNGSKHFPPGKLLPLLGSLGMTFGADTNAHTSLRETVYKLNLPDTQPKHLELACKIFADYAGGLLLTDEEIQNERKVILEEARTGKGAAKRLQTQEMKAAFSDTKLGIHDVIGDEDQIKSFPASTFRDYWNTWYRPENMVLIVVGDVKPDDIVPLAKQWLGGIDARTQPKPADKAGLHPLTQPKAFVFTDPEQVTGGVELLTLAPGQPPTTTYEQFRHYAQLDLATDIVNRRIRNQIAAGHAPYREASAGAGQFLNEVTLASADAEGEPADWKPMLTGLVTAMDQAVEHGFLPGELKLVERGQLAAAEQAVVAEPTRDSTSVINEISGKIGENEPLLSAQQELDLTKRVFAETDAATLKAGFDAAFNTKNYDYVLNLPKDKPGFMPPTPEEVLATAATAWQAKTPAPTADSEAEGLLATRPMPGQIKTTDTDADLKISTVTFANGVVLHHKFSAYKKDQVLVSVTLPGGQIEENDGDRGVSTLASVLLEQPATGRFSSTQLRDYMTGKNVTVGGTIGRDTLTVQVAGNNKDLPAGMDLAYALLTDGKLEQSAVDDWKKATHQTIAKAKTQAQPQLRKLVSETILGGDPRFRPLADADVDRLTRDDGEAWFKRIATNAAVEVAVVGDISLDDTTKLVAGTIGALPQRPQGFDALDAARKIDRRSGPYERTASFQSVTPTAIALAGFVSCDDTNPDRRPLALAAEVLTTRMIDRVREKEQLVYSIDADSSPGRGLPGTGLFYAAAPTDPKNAATLGDEVVSMMADFAKTGPTDEELATAKKQILTETTTAMRDPAWWLGQIGEMAYRKRAMADLKNLPGVFDTFTADDLKDVVAKYYKPEAVIKLAAVPSSPASTQPATMKAAAQ